MSSAPARRSAATVTAGISPSIGGAGVAAAGPVHAVVLPAAATHAVRCRFHERGAPAAHAAVSGRGGSRAEGPAVGLGWHAELLAEVAAQRRRGAHARPRRDLLDTQVRGLQHSCARRTRWVSSQRSGLTPVTALKCRARLRELIPALRARFGAYTTK